MPHESWGSKCAAASQLKTVSVLGWEFNTPSHRGQSTDGFKREPINLRVRAEVAPMVAYLVKSTADVWGGVRKGATWGTVCFAGETRVVTPDGDVPIADLAGTEARLLTRDPFGKGRARWVDAPVRSFGTQALHKITLSRYGVEKVIHATAEHRWFREYRRSGTERSGYGSVECTTVDLEPGHRLANCLPHSTTTRTTPSHVGIAHGLVTGDGTIRRRPRSRTEGLGEIGEGVIQLYGAKNWPLARFFPQGQAQSSHYLRDGYAEAYVEIRGLPTTWKRLPSLDESSSYLYGWLAGYFAADGRIGADGSPVTIDSVDRENLEFAEAVCRRLGVMTFGIKCTRKADPDRDPVMINGNEASAVRAMWSLSIDPRGLSEEFFVIPDHLDRWKDQDYKRPPTWKVESVESTDRVEEVYCAVVPETESFALADYVLTGNCRPIRGGTRLSNHSFGLALDFSSDRGPMVKRKSTDLFDPRICDWPPEIVLLWESYGWRWGGKYGTTYQGRTGSGVQGFPDGLKGIVGRTVDCMHIEYMGSKAQAVDLSKKATELFLAEKWGCAPDGTPITTIARTGAALTEAFDVGMSCDAAKVVEWHYAEARGATSAATKDSRGKSHYALHLAFAKDRDAAVGTVNALRAGLKLAGTVT